VPDHNFVDHPFVYSVQKGLITFTLVVETVTGVGDNVVSCVGQLQVVVLSLEVARRLLMGARDPGVDDLGLFCVLGTCLLSIRPEELEKGRYVVKSLAFGSLTKCW
jgi:hypothetical protein